VLAGWMTSAPVATQAGSAALQDKPHLCKTSRTWSEQGRFSQIVL
jgi:hypothetical protein